jgi:hypothetical protein
MPIFCTNITPICTPKKIFSIIPISTPSEPKSGFRSPCSSLVRVKSSIEDKFEAQIEDENRVFHKVCRVATFVYKKTTMSNPNVFMSALSAFDGLSNDLFFVAILSCNNKNINMRM